MRVKRSNGGSGNGGVSYQREKVKKKTAIFKEAEAGRKLQLLSWGSPHDVDGRGLESSLIFVGA